MKKFKNGFQVEMTTEEAEKMKRRFEKYRHSKQPSLADYEAKIKSLEESLAAVLAQLNKDATTEELATEETAIEEPAAEQGE